MAAESTPAAHGDLGRAVACSSDVQVVLDSLRTVGRIWIATHADPDGDAIGSLLGAGRALDRAGWQVSLACADPVPPDLRFLPGWQQIGAHGPDPHAHDLALALDAGDAKRLGAVWDAASWRAMPSLVIDHHVSNTGFGDRNWIDARAASTAEMIVELLAELAIEPDEEIATCLLTGIVTDTIGFRTPNTRGRTLAAAERLMRAGAPLDRITQRIFSSRPLAALQLQGRALDRLRVEPPFALTRIRLDDLAELGVGPDAARGISSHLATAAEPIAVAVLREREDGRIDVSMRARPGSDLGPAATALGGGGHALAAGARVEGPLDAAEERVLEALRRHVTAPEASA